jgi:hypothetical protein
MKPYYVLLLTYGNKIDVDRIRCRMEYGTGTIGIDGKVEGKWREVGIVEEHIKDRPGVGSITLWWKSTYTLNIRMRIGNTTYWVIIKVSLGRSSLGNTIIWCSNHPYFTNAWVGWRCRSVATKFIWLRNVRYFPRQMIISRQFNHHIPVRGKSRRSGRETWHLNLLNQMGNQVVCALVLAFLLLKAIEDTHKLWAPL